MKKKFKVSIVIGSFLLAVVFSFFTNPASACDKTGTLNGFCSTDDVCAYIASDQDCNAGIAEQL